MFIYTMRYKFFDCGIILLNQCNVTTLNEELTLRIKEKR